MSKKVIVVDIDGTIASCEARVEEISKKKPDWDKFYDRCDEDEPIKPIINLVEVLQLQGHPIVFCTGRKDFGTVREKTEAWIKENFNHFFEYEALLMRKDGDYRHDTEAKPELLVEYGIDLDKIHFILEDRNSMVAKWRELGIRCLQVADGDF
jgi:hydroxymethylpyrimidine pyrophosphatase-like HAD family hydrolase